MKLKTLTARATDSIGTLVQAPSITDDRGLGLTEIYVMHVQRVTPK